MKRLQERANEQKIYIADKIFMSKINSIQIILCW